MGGSGLAAKPQLLAWQGRASLSRCEIEVRVRCNLAGRGLVGGTCWLGERALESGLASFWFHVVLEGHQQISASF